MRQAGKVLEGVFFLLFLAPSIAITVVFGVVPLFGSRGGSSTLLAGDLSFWLGIIGYAALVLAAVARIVEGLRIDLESNSTFAFRFLAASGCIALLTAIVVAASGR